MTRHAVPASLSSLVLLAAVACGGGGDAADTAPPAPNEVTVRASDFAYDLPLQIPSGYTTFRLVNDGPNYHHMIVGRIDSGRTYSDAMAALSQHGPPPAWIVPVGGPNVPDMGSEANATLDLAPGEYVLFCMVDVPGGVPHTAKGMVRQLTVTPATGPAAAPPTAHIKLTMADYQFTFSSPITAGTHTFEVVTSPGQPHEIEIFRLAPGKTVDDLLKEFSELMSGAKTTAQSAVAVGGVAPAVAGVTQYFTASFTPGSYVLACFLPDAKDGKLHMEHGMLQVIEVQ